MPLVGLAFLLAAFFWGQREFKLRFFGESAEGRIVGMVLQRADNADLLTGLDIDLRLSLASGQQITARYANGVLTRATADDEGNKHASADALVAELSAELRRVLSEAASGDATVIRWALQREGRRSDDPRRVLRIEKTETVSGWFGVPILPEVLDWHEGRLQLRNEAISPETAKVPAYNEKGIVRIHAAFDRSDLNAVQAQKGETLVSYSYELNGESIVPTRKNFFLYAEPYTTEFRPVFAYNHAGKGVARLSHIGRQGGPTLALRLFEPCLVYVDPQKPEQAVVTAVPGPVAGAPLTWFSRLCEGIFAQWGTVALIAFAGTMFIVVGLLYVTLSIWPSKRI